MVSSGQAGGGKDACQGDSGGPLVETAVELGGTVMMPPNDMDFGRGAVVADPQGAVFGMAVVTDGAI